jgi:MFS family permease
MRFNSKTLLLILLLEFAISNIIAGLVHNYYLIIGMRLIGGICAGVMWPMIAAFGMRLVELNHHADRLIGQRCGNISAIQYVQLCNYDCIIGWGSSSVKFLSVESSRFIYTACNTGNIYFTYGKKDTSY